jgi:hypothetical protein
MMRADAPFIKSQKAVLAALMALLKAKSRN